MPTGWTMGLWQGERDTIQWACVHCGERSEAGGKPFSRGLCDFCNSVEKRKEMHEENLAVNSNWFCKVCTKLSTSLQKPKPTTSADEY